MGWKITLDDGTVVDLGKLPPSFYEKQAIEEGVDYWNIYFDHPARKISRFEAFLDAAVEKWGIDRPVFEDMDAFQDFTNDPEKVSVSTPIQDLPMEGGFPTTPGETETGSTSTSPGDPTDGLLTSPGNNP